MRGSSEALIIRIIITRAADALVFPSCLGADGLALAVSGFRPFKRPDVKVGGAGGLWLLPILCTCPVALPTVSIISPLFPACARLFYVNGDAGRLFHFFLPGPEQGSKIPGRLTASVWLTKSGKRYYLSGDRGSVLRDFLSLLWPAAPVWFMLVILQRRGIC